MAVAGRTGWLDRIERAGNALPDPVTLFALGAVAVALLSQLAVGLGWTVEKSVLGPDGQPVLELVEPLGMLTAEGIYWLLRNLVANFVGFPPLGVVLVGMLGIGLAERAGLVGALLKALLVTVPRRLLTPALVFVGVLSSLGLDAGYVVLPPLGAALFMVLGRPPLAGLAAVFAGVAAGFGANLVVTSLDPMLAEFSAAGAHLVDPDYAVAATANWWFMIASTVLLTGAGWWVTARIVEPRLSGAPTGETEPLESPAAITRDERRGLVAAGAVFACFALALALSTLPGGVLAGSDGVFPRWVRAIVPLLFLGFLLPGIAYGVTTGTLRSDKDAARMLGETMAGMGPYIAMAFFAAQFIALFAPMPRQTRSFWIMTTR